MLFAITSFILFILSSRGIVAQTMLMNGSSLNTSSSFSARHNMCKELVNCICSVVHGYVTVTCKGLRDIDKLLSFLHNRYEYSKISHIYISKSFIEHLPAGAFQNLSVSKIFIYQSSVLNVSNDAFLGITGLIELGLKDFDVATIPSSIKTLNNTLRELRMEKGGLESLQQTLQNSTQMQLLSLKRNRISIIDYRAFLHMTNLDKLDLSNNTIKWLDPRTFSSLSQLSYLSLIRNHLENTDGLFDNLQFTIKIFLLVTDTCLLYTLVLLGNNISDIRNVTKNPLYSLNMLSLGGNPLRMIRNDSFKKYPELRLLYLSSAQLTSVDPMTFRSITRLLFLTMSYNMLSQLDNQTFASLSALQGLEIYDNRLETISGLFQHTLRLRELYASNNRIIEIDQQCFENTPDLTNLFLNENHLRRVQDDTFVHNGMLQKLQLSSNRIRILGPGSFRGLHNLVDLNLGDNLLKTLNRSLNNLPSLKVLDLSGNYLTILDADAFLNMPSLQVVNATGNSIASVEGAFVHSINLRNLTLRYNRLETITQDSFSFSAPLEVLELSGNPLTCNCLLKWLVQLIADETVTVDNVTCKMPEWLNKKPLKHLSLKDITEWPKDCPQDCTCTCFPNSTDYYIGVYCAGLHLITTPDVLPVKTGCLDLSRNQIDSVAQLTLDNLTQLEYLFLHQNNLTSIPDFSATKLRTLTLANNHLTRFPVSRVHSTFLEHANLSNNPWLCDCQTLTFRKWLLSEEVVVLDVNNTKCDDVESNGNLRNKPIVSLTEELLCPSLVAFYASIIAAVLGFLLFVAGGKIAYNRYRMNIKIWMYSRGICSCLSCVKEEDLDEDKQFDAFISYSSLDEMFVVHHLVPMLECREKPYHLCLHYRHFAPGSYVQDSIIQAVQLSKRTILVLSKNFLQSEWCRLEFKSAHHLVLEERLNRLIVIILGEMPPKEDIDPEIKLYLETTTYLRWGEKNFWNKLNYVMPRSPCVVTEEDKMRLLD